MSFPRARAQCQAPLENKRLNLIPVGRQLQRTPPTKSSNTRKTTIKDEEDSQVGFLQHQQSHTLTA